MAGLEDMAQLLSSLVALPWDLVRSPEHTKEHTTINHSISRGLNTFWPVQAPGRQAVQTHIYRQNTQTHTINKSYKTKITSHWTSVTFKFLISNNEHCIPWLPKRAVGGKAMMKQCILRMPLCQGPEHLQVQYLYCPTRTLIPCLCGTITENSKTTTNSHPKRTREHSSVSMGWDPPHLSGIVLLSGPWWLIEWERAMRKALTLSALIGSTDPCTPKTIITWAPNCPSHWVTLPSICIFSGNSLNNKMRKGDI